jgi:hypothetical protein
MAIPIVSANANGLIEAPPKIITATKVNNTVMEVLTERTKVWLRLMLTVPSKSSVLFGKFSRIRINFYSPKFTEQGKNSERNDCIMN